MTLVIATAVPEGVILTADSRQTYTNRAGLPRIASDHASKVVEINASKAVATAGGAFFWDSGKLKSIQSYLEEFKAGPSQGLTTTQDVADALKLFTEGWILRLVGADLDDAVRKEGGTELAIGKPKDGNLTYEYKDANGLVQKKDWSLNWVNFIVAGRDPSGVCHAINVFPFHAIVTRSSSEAPGVQWIGQTEVLVKLLTGNDAFVINTNTMTVQDAIDFSILLTRTTENIQKFSDGTAGSQGGIPGVGGPIDVVFIPGKEGNLVWLNRKTLHVGNSPA